MASLLHHSSIAGEDEHDDVGEDWTFEHDTIHHDVLSNKHRSSSHVDLQASPHGILNNKWDHLFLFLCNVSPSCSSSQDLHPHILLHLSSFSFQFPLSFSSFLFLPLPPSSIVDLPKDTSLPLLSPLLHLPHEHCFTLENIDSFLSPLLLALHHLNPSSHIFFDVPKNPTLFSLVLDLWVSGQLYK